MFVCFLTFGEDYPLVTDGLSVLRENTCSAQTEYFACTVFIEIFHHFSLNFNEAKSSQITEFFFFFCKFLLLRHLTNCLKNVENIKEIKCLLGLVN